MTIPMKLGPKLHNLALLFPVVCFIFVSDQTLAEQLYHDKGRFDCLTDRQTDGRTDTLTDRQLGQWHGLIYQKAIDCDAEVKKVYFSHHLLLLQGGPFDRLKHFSRNSHHHRTPFKRSKSHPSRGYHRLWLLCLNRHHTNRGYIEITVVLCQDRWTSAVSSAPSTQAVIIHLFLMKISSIWGF